MPRIWTEEKALYKRLALISCWKKKTQTPKQSRISEVTLWRQWEVTCTKTVSLEDWSKLQKCSRMFWQSQEKLRYAFVLLPRPAYTLWLLIRITVVFKNLLEPQSLSMYFEYCNPKKGLFYAPRIQRLEFHLKICFNYWEA